MVMLSLDKCLMLISGSKPFRSQLKQGLSILTTMKKLLKTEKSYTLPLLHAKLSTDTGLPVTVKLDKHGIIKLDSNIKVLPEETSLKKTPLRKLDLDMQIRPR